MGKPSGNSDAPEHTGLLSALGSRVSGHGRLRANLMADGPPSDQGSINPVSGQMHPGTPHPGDGSGGKLG